MLFTIENNAAQLSLVLSNFVWFSINANYIWIRTWLNAIYQIFNKNKNVPACHCRSSSRDKSYKVVQSSDRIQESWCGVSTLHSCNRAVKETSNSAWRRQGAFLLHPLSELTNILYLLALVILPPVLIGWHNHRRKLTFINYLLLADTLSISPLIGSI